MDAAYAHADPPEAKPCPICSTRAAVPVPLPGVVLELRSVPVLVGSDMVWLGRGVMSALRMPTRLLSMMATTPDTLLPGPDELADLWRSAREVHALVCGVHGAGAALFGVQDGRGAGQSVPHAHIHIIPR